MSKPVTQAIVDFLAKQRGQHTGADLLDRYLKHGTDLETQVNVAAGDGEPVADKRHTWTDGVREWWNLRIPKNAWDRPEFRDYRLSWPLELHAEGIGTTGWDWKAKRSRWLGYDFDALTNHAAGVGLTDDDLAEVRRQAEALPYIEVRKSTGGNGIHLYVLFGDEGVPTANHTEHAALSRCVLGLMSSVTGFDFAGQIDCCGSVMWIWHRKLAKAGDGLKLIKPAGKILTLSDLPSNWKEHIEVVTRRRTKIRVKGLSEEDEDPFEQLASARRLIPLDEDHKALIDELSRTGYSTVWVSDHHLLQTHTCALRQLLDDPETTKELNLKGVFQTNSPGSDRATPNCFMFPLPNGAWKVYRFGAGVAEDASWQQDGEGWTTCYFNHAPDFTTAARALGGAELADGKGYQFDSAEHAIQVVKTLGFTGDVTLDNKYVYRETTLRANKDGRLVLGIEKRKDEAKPGPGWATVRGGRWEKVIDIRTDPIKDELDAAPYDDELRRLNTPTCELAGWFIHDHNKDWSRCNASECKYWLQKQGNTKGAAEITLGGCVENPWKLVNLPFQPEYPGGRQWNYNAPQFKYAPVILHGDAEPKHPHWDLILQHCFCDLDAELKQLQWAQEANIRTGAQYGLAWVACCFREPFEQLPFLFFFGNQECGKSIFHEALSLLVTGGVVSAGRALTNQAGFNGELANAVLAYVEEIKLTGIAYDRIKEWVTAKVIWLRKMRTDAYPQPNTLHFVQMANDQAACPVFPGDTRITVIEVPDLLPGQQIPKPILEERLIEEAPHFMHTLLNVELPKIQGRLRLPVVETYKKTRSEDMQRSPLETFIAEECYLTPGHKIPFAEFYERFIKWLDDGDRYDWSKIKVSRSLPSNTPSGAHTDNKRFVGNLSWTPLDIDPNQPPYICVDGRLKVQTLERHP